VNLRYLTFPIIGLIAGGVIYLAARWGWDALDGQIPFGLTDTGESQSEVAEEVAQALTAISEHANHSIPPAIFRNVAEVDGEIILRGTAQKNAEVSILDKSETIQTVIADSDGVWTLNLSMPGVQELALSLKSKIDDITIPSDELLFIVRDANYNNSLILLTAPGGPSRIISSPFRTLPEGDGLTLGAIDYDERGSAIFSGFSDRPGRVRVYGDWSVIGETGVTIDGRWFLIAGEALPDSIYNLRFELRETNRAASVIGVDMHPMPKDIDIDAPIYVSKDENMWHVRRRLIGGGQQYTAIMSPDFVLSGDDLLQRESLVIDEAPAQP